MGHGGWFMGRQFNAEVIVWAVALLPCCNPIDYAALQYRTSRVERMHLVKQEPAPQDTMMPRMDFTEIGMDMAALVRTIVQTNLRVVQELSQAKTPQAMADLQRRFAGEYIRMLQYGTMSFMNALRPQN
jgi:hypothetical protein